jgi:hypothetical protein
MSNVYNTEPPTKGKVCVLVRAMTVLCAPPSVHTALAVAHAGPCVCVCVCVCLSHPSTRRPTAHRKHTPPRNRTAACNAQVTLHTTLGHLDIELWPKEAPKVRGWVRARTRRSHVGSTHTGRVAARSQRAALAAASSTCVRPAAAATPTHNAHTPPHTRAHNRLCATLCSCAWRAITMAASSIG